MLKLLRCYKRNDRLEKKIKEWLLVNKVNLGCIKSVIGQVDLFGFNRRYAEEEIARLISFASQDSADNTKLVNIKNSLINGNWDRAVKISKELKITNQSESNNNIFILSTSIIYDPADPY